MVKLILEDVVNVFTVIFLFYITSHLTRIQSHPYRQLPSLASAPRDSRTVLMMDYYCRRLRSKRGLCERESDIEIQVINKNSIKNYHVL